jgi:hypothetical protein
MQKIVEIDEMLTMKRRTGTALLLRPLTLFSFPTISYFFPNFYDIFGLIFDLYRGQQTCRRTPRRLRGLYRRRL